MSTTPTAVTLVGATGLVGSRSLLSLLSSSSPFNITTLTRRAPDAPKPVNVCTTIETRLLPDLFDAPKAEQSIAVKGGVYISALGTTRAAAGSTAAQEKIDLVLNRDLAKRAKEDGADTVILVSSGGASATSRFFYTRIKGQLEEDIKAMGFKTTVILRPALLLGERSTFRGPEAIAQFAFRGLMKIGLPLDQYAIDATEVGQAIAYLAAHPPSEKLTTLWDPEILAYAKKYREANANPASSS